MLEGLHTSRVTLLSVCAFFLTTAPLPVIADVFRCDANGETVYQQSPCDDGLKQKALDDRQDRRRRAAIQAEIDRREAIRREKEEAEARARQAAEEEARREARQQEEARLSRERAVREMNEEREKYDAKLVEKYQMLRFCIQTKECNAYVYSETLRCMSDVEIENIFGKPQTSQRLGGKNLLYYTVPTVDDARGATRLQLELGYCQGISGYGLRSGNRVVNINNY